MPAIPKYPVWHDDYILMHYALQNTKDIAAHLGRLPRQISARAFSLDVKKAPGAKGKRVGIFSPAADEVMREKYASHTNEELEAILGLPRLAIAHRANALKLHKSPETISRTARLGLLRMDRHAGQFQKGRDTWNKGLKGYSVALGRGHFTVGTKPPTWVPVGAERWTVPPRDRPHAQRYLKRKIAEPNVWQMVHRWTWEQHHGPIPMGHTVIFSDGDTANTAIENLRCVPRQTLATSSGAGIPVEMVEVYKLTRQLATAIRETEQPK